MPGALRITALLVALLCLSLPARAASPFLEVDSPGPKGATLATPLIEVTGFGGSRRGNGHDVVIAIDLSESTLADSGLELDGDLPADRTDPELVTWLEGELGEARIVRLLRDEQDFDDTVLAAELAAAAALAARLDPARFRVGVVAFAETARVVAPLGGDRGALMDALAALPRDLHRDSAGTNYQAAIEVSHELLRPPGDPHDGILRSIVFLSDGAPTRPLLGDRAERYAVDAAAAAGGDGIRLFAFAIGPEAEAGLTVLEKMAGWTSGRLESVRRPGQIVNRLRELDLVGLAQLDVRNATTGAPARALRTFPDGSFDGFIELAEGRNKIHFAARDSHGIRHEVERWVTYQVPADDEAGGPDVAAAPNGGAGGDDADPAGGDDDVYEALRARTAEIEAMREIERVRQQRKDLELRVEDRPRDSAPRDAAGGSDASKDPPDASIPR